MAGAPEASDGVLDISFDDEYPEIDLDDAVGPQLRAAGPPPVMYPAASKSRMAPLQPRQPATPPPGIGQPAGQGGAMVPQPAYSQRPVQPWWPLLLVFGGPVGCVLAPFILLAGFGVALFACYFAPLLLSGVIALFIWFQDRSKPVVRTRYIWVTIACGAALTLAWIAVIVIVGTTGANHTQPSS